MNRLTQLVPLLAVADLNSSLSFYVGGLGFQLVNRWEVDGQLRWCRIQRSGVDIMLQQFFTRGPDAKTFSGRKGEGALFCIFCEDAIEVYRELISQGIAATEPQVSNGLWCTELTDPDGYELLFESPTSDPEGIKLSDR